MNKGEIALITTTGVATPQALAAARTLEVTLSSTSESTFQSPPKRPLLYTYSFLPLSARGAALRFAWYTDHDDRECEYRQMRF